MKKVLVISGDDALIGAVATALEPLDAEVDTRAEWSEAKDALFKAHYELVCIDYRTVRIEGLDTFILIDNILQKERSPGVLLLQKESQRARQFAESLSSFEKTINLAEIGPAADALRKVLEPLLAAQSTAPSSEASDAAVDQISVELPELSGGDLGETPLGRLLYALHVEEADGILELSMGAIERRYGVAGGQLIRGGDYADRTTLRSAFAWDGGQWGFEADEAVEGEGYDLLDLVARAVERHAEYRQIMGGLMPQMKRYPVQTTFRDERAERIAQDQDLVAFLDACDGQTTLEKALASLGSRATQAIKAAFFAVCTDLVALRDQPYTGRLRVVYGGARRAKTVQTEEAKKATKAYRAAGTGRIDLEQELREHLAQMEQSTPYEIFDVWEGCGREVVQEKFYDLVKLHHPDVYGGNVSGDVKRLAQEIFIGVKDAYQALIKVEREQMVSPPASDSEASFMPEHSFAAETLGEESSFVTDPAPTEESEAEGPHTRPTAPVQRPLTGKATPRRTQSSPGNEARKSQIERLKSRRNATPIGLGRRESSAGAGHRPSQSDRRPTNPDERRAKLEKLKRASQTGARASVTGNTGVLNPGDIAQEHFNKGYRAWRQDQISIAYDHFSQAYNLEPDNATYMTFYGYLLFRRDPEKVEQAKKVLEKAIEMKHRQSLPDAYVFMGQIQKVVGTERKAYAYFKKALALNPKSIDAQREVRLHKMRHGDDDPEDDAGSKSFFKNLFKK